MIARIYPAVLYAALLGATSPAAAQQPGDSLRVRMDRQSEWVYGRLVRSDTVNLYLFSGGQERAFPLASVWRAEARRRQDPVRQAILGGVIGVGMGAISFVAPRPNEQGMSSRTKMIVTVAAGLGGATTGVILATARPYEWKRVRVRPGILPQPAAPRAGP